MGEVSKAVIHVPVVADAFFMVMNWGSWNKLSAEHKAVLEALSGDYAVAWAGKMWDDNNKKGIDAFPNLNHITPNT